MKKVLLASLLVFGFTSIAVGVVFEEHSHDDSLVDNHGGGLDKRGGHNCSAKSKAKGLCTGYHYHR